MENYWWLNEESQNMLGRGYLRKGQTAQSKIKKVSYYAANILGMPELGHRFENIFAKGWASMSSPIWANFAEDRGLPISCFGSHVPDSVQGIYESLTEVAKMTQMGGGTAGYFPLRPKGSPVSGGGESSGLMSFLELFDVSTKVVSQAGVRRGAFAAYVEIDHPEIMDFLKIKHKSSNLQTMLSAVCIGDDWMREMIDGDVDKRTVWAEVLKARRERGFPYLFFKDNVNNNKPQVYKDKDIMINHSQLCNEIYLPTNEEESFVCCLLSLNLALYDEWKDTDTVELMIYFLDAVMTDFIDKAKDEPSMKRAVRFAEKHRALGLGVLGWHSYLQSKGIPFEDLEANLINAAIFKGISEKATKASKELAEKLGEPEILKGYGLRNATTMAVAPTISSSSILGQVSPGIEPYPSNYYVFGSAKGSFTRRNPELVKLLESLGKNTDEVWDSIMTADGSVQKLDFLTDRQKEVFKTFSEISPYAIINQAAARQKYIDQGQSLNIKIPKEMDIKEVNKIHIHAWESGLKGMYYQRGTSATKDLIQSMLNCKSCEG